MIISEQHIERLSEILLRDLLEQGQAQLRRDRPAALACIAQTLRAQFQVEQELEKEARRLLEAHLTGAPADVDRHRLLQMIRRRLAEEKGVPL